MKRSNKKGFTLVELVIVVAVIAILAGVLIPTIAGVVRKANTAADTALAKDMNTALAAYTGENGKAPANFDEVVAVLEAAGYDILALNAKADGNYYAWDKANNQIVYIAKDGKTIYKNKDFKNEDLVRAISGTTAIKDAVTAGGDVVVLEDVATTGMLSFTKYTAVDLADATITFDKSNTSNTMFCAMPGGTLVLSGNGTVNAVNNEDLKNDDGKDKDSIAIWAYGGDVVIDGGTYTNVGCGTEEHYDLIYATKGGKITINGGKFICQTPEWTLNVKDSNPGTIIVKGGEFFEFDPSNLPANLAGKDIIFDTNAYKVTPDVREDGTWYVVSAK